MEGVAGGGGPANSPVIKKLHKASRIYQFYLDKSTPHAVPRYSVTNAFFIAFMTTFFSVFDISVFWPILLCYWIVLFVLTMKRQIAHMIKYRYIPFSIGKQKYGGKKPSKSNAASSAE